jgi:hypothetical protein
MNKVIYRSMAVAAAVTIAFGGSAVASPSVALAQGGQGCATANAKGGPSTCRDGGAAPVGEREANCYRLGIIGLIFGALTGGAGGGLGGFGAGCSAAVTAP